VSVEVDEPPPTAKATADGKVKEQYMYNIGHSGTPAILKLNSISFSQHLAETNRRRFSSANTTAHQTHSANKLLDRGVSHSFIDHQ
jgi:hypothetical protein